MEASETAPDSFPRPEYPRPSFVRRRWMSLNGWWELALDPEEEGLKAQWYRAHDFSQRILVPYPVESPLSQVGDRGCEEALTTV
jgi:hypothetical protein